MGGVLMLGFWLGMYYGCVLGFLTAITYRHWTSLYEPRAYIHEEPEITTMTTFSPPPCRRNGP